MGKDTCTILILVGILLFVISWPVKEENPNGNDGKIRDDSTEESAIENMEETEKIYNVDSDISYVKNQEQRLEQVLSVVEGVGRVEVMITLESTSEQIIEKDQPTSRSITTENDGDGGNRNVNDMTSEDTTVYIMDSDGNQRPYVVKELEPVIEGVTVVAQGGGNPVINKNITDIIQALFGIEPHKIMVVKMKS